MQPEQPSLPKITHTDRETRDHALPKTTVKESAAMRVLLRQLISILRSFCMLSPLHLLENALHDASADAELPADLQMP
jgi:hypothetical protein